MATIETNRAAARAANHKQEAEDYKTIARDATAIQIASEAFSIYMSLPTTDPAKFWDYLSGSISAYNSIDLFSNLMKLYGNTGNLSEDAVRKMLENQRTSLREARFSRRVVIFRGRGRRRSFGVSCWWSSGLTLTDSHSSKNP